MSPSSRCRSTVSAYLKTTSDRLQIAFHSDHAKDNSSTVPAFDDEIGARVSLVSTANARAQFFNIVACYLFGIGHTHGHASWNGDLIDAEVGVGTDDCPRTEVHTLSAQIPTKATLLTFQPLAETHA